MKTEKKTVTIFTMKTTYGGIERFVATLANMLAEDYKVNIIATYGERGKESFMFRKDIEIEYLIAEAPKIISAKSLIKRFDILGLLKEIPRRTYINYSKKTANKKALRKIHADFVITERAYYSELVGRFLHSRKTTKIATEHNYHQNDKKYTKRLINSVRCFDYLVLPTKELFDYYMKIDMQPKRMLIPNSIPEIRKKKTNLRTKNIIAAGRLEPEKGFLELIEVMHLLSKSNPTVKLFLVGDGSERNQIEARIRKYKLEKTVIMLGFLTQDEIETYFYKSSIYVMTSKTEAFGLVLLEAMSFGLPCIAFDGASGPRELITKDIGVLIKGEDINDMATTIIELLNDPKRLVKFQKNISGYIKKFSVAVVKEKWLKILRQQTSSSR